ncbi:MAG: UDP-N-acetylglucosamine--N-acetylmuramyl-(pentapeptide) pyrophosphoryl-undecaprenol N-acetylglucosamine transferase [Candidatus Margulisbacteria bacterium]|nr:UDP-N-acetylglucosamine--N-acetylmuramyl-(pentapeptide) pyrophosphoryl-undecaprenol N-acetylglucosamine transferase [Candidatus Margulisiibacteriota bacterium]
MIIFTCGGTGGHITPALNIAGQLQSEFLFIGGNRLEKELLKDVPFMEITTSPRNPLLILKGIRQALRILKNKKPKAVFSTGGYVAFPVSIASIILRIPLVLLEQNSIPGRVNRFLSPFATLIFTGFPDFKKILPVKKTVCSGNPVASCAHLIRKKKNKVLVMGGSQGARKLNRTMLELLKLLPGEKLELIWLTGNKNYREIENELEKMPGLSVQGQGSYLFDDIKIQLLPFHSKVTDMLPDIKFAISRAGAMSIAELTAYEIPAIYVPYPHAADNHQFYNAAFVTQKKGGVLLEDKDLTAQTLYDSLKILMANYADFVHNLQVMNKTNALTVIMLELAKRGLN